GDFSGSLQSSVGISSREGLQSFSLGYTGSIQFPSSNTLASSQITTGGTASFSFGQNAYSPQIGTEYRGVNLTRTVKGGYFPKIVAPGTSINISYFRQRLKDRGKVRKTPAYGYLNWEAASEEDALLDFNRTNDGPIREANSNLAIPQTTPDIYSVMGQGTGGMYRPYRSKVALLSDPKEQSLSGGGRLGVEVDPGDIADVGIDIGGSFAVSRSGKWSGTESLFTGTPDEDYYFKAAGEMTAEPTGQYDYIGGEKAVRLMLGNKLIPTQRLNYDNAKKLEFTDGSEKNITTGARPDRKPRGQSIQQYTNKDLLNPSTTESLKEYRIQYYDTYGTYDSAPSVDLVRDADNQGSHFAGITALQNNGIRYVYALPAKNTLQEETVFSITPPMNCNPVYSGYSLSTGETDDCQAELDEINYCIPNTDQYFNKTTVPEYAHAFLLTSVLGADYVDLGTPGPSDEDYGYWVKFNYVKTSDAYQWKTPFNGANYLKGKITDNRDDKAAISYGKREQYYLATAETRTHIAKFYIEKRNDGRGVSTRYQKASDAFGDFSYLLEKVELYSKLGLENDPAVDPIKTVHFEYSYELCPGVHNQDNAAAYSDHVDASLPGGGKLTLTKVWFTYENSNRGSLS
ncbi:MAG: hypothetical protein AAFP19_26580, partial [Bacteroidota bacterium]